MRKPLRAMTKKRQLQKIYSRTDGNCHICHRKLVFSNYAIHGLKVAWQIEHSVPKAKGGTNHLNNLFAACISCNLKKGILTTGTARRRNGFTRAPYSNVKRQKIEHDNIAKGVVIGAFLGLVGGPIGSIIGGTLGGYIGKNNSPLK